ncbi:MAG TPA: hypothetical protein VM577_11495 [Anaerovoracaceae bacterium]|nr:hypothetical protein [Anaerovoracaceae bacterium]
MKLNLAKWHKVERVYFKTGSSFFTKDTTPLVEGVPHPNYRIASCCVLGAVMFMEHATKNDPLPEEERKYLTSGWAYGAKILGVKDTWAIGLTLGWDAIGLDNKTTEANDFLRELQDTEAYDFGIELREKFNGNFC